MYYDSFSVSDGIFHLKSIFNRILETLIRYCVLMTSDLDLHCLYIYELKACITIRFQFGMVFVHLKSKFQQNI